MKLIVATIRSERLGNVLEELFKVGVEGLTVSPAQGHGGERDHVETFRGTQVVMKLSEKMRVVEPTVQAIIKGARTGDVGDGKVFVMPVEKVYRIRTGEVDQAAVTPVHVKT